MRNLISQPHFNMSEIKNIPRLRFSEFESEWVKHKIGDFFKVSAGGDIKSTHVSKTKTSRFIYPIFANSLENNGLYGYSDLYRSTGGVLTITGRGVNIGSVNARFESFYPIVRLLVLKPIHESSIKFLEYQLNQLKILIESTGVPQLTAPQISKYYFQAPLYKEQQKIADFLTAVDKRIELLEKKKTLLETYKKGVMKKIFNQEIRFKDDNGNDFPDWEEKRLGEISKITTGRLDANAMVDGGQYRFYTCAKDYYHIDNFSFDTDALIISGNGANVGYIHHYKGKFNAYQRTYVLDGFEESILYVKFFLDRYLKARIESEKKEGNTPYIVKSTLEDMKIQLPTF